MCLSLPLVQTSQDHLHNRAAPSLFYQRSPARRCSTCNCDRVAPPPPPPPLACVTHNRVILLASLRWAGRSGAWEKGRGGGGVVTQLSQLHAQLAGQTCFDRRRAGCHGSADCACMPLVPPTMSHIHSAQPRPSKAPSRDAQALQHFHRNALRQCAAARAQITAARPAAPGACFKFQILEVDLVGMDSVGPDAEVAAATSLQVRIAKIWARPHRREDPMTLRTLLPHRHTGAAARRGGASRRSRCARPLLAADSRNAVTPPPSCM